MTTQTVVFEDAVRGEMLNKLIRLKIGLAIKNALFSLPSDIKAYPGYNIDDALIIGGPIPASYQLSVFLKATNELNIMFKPIELEYDWVRTNPTMGEVAEFIIKKDREFLDSL